MVKEKELKVTMENRGVDFDLVIEDDRGTPWAFRGRYGWEEGEKPWPYFKDDCHAYPVGTDETVNWFEEILLHDLWGFIEKTEALFEVDEMVSEYINSTQRFGSGNFYRQANQEDTKAVKSLETMSQCAEQLSSLCRGYASQPPEKETVKSRVAIPELAEYILLTLGDEHDYGGPLYIYLVPIDKIEWAEGLVKAKTVKNEYL